MQAICVPITCVKNSEVLLVLHLNPLKYLIWGWFRQEIVAKSMSVSDMQSCEEKEKWQIIIRYCSLLLVEFSTLLHLFLTSYCHPEHFLLIFYFILFIFCYQGTACSCPEMSSALCSWSRRPRFPEFSDLQNKRQSLSLQKRPRYVDNINGWKGQIGWK